MNRISTSLGVAAVALTGLILSAEDFQPLMEATRTTWPEKKHIGVICDYKKSKDQVLALAKAAGPDAHITVADTRLPHHVNSATNIIEKQKADYVVLMPKDRFFYDGSFGATLALSRLAHRGVPAIGTTPVALKQGAVFSVGDGTNGEILVANRLIGIIDVILPDRATIGRKASLVLPREGMATISVRAAE